MKATGIVRRIDDLGRVVIPKEIRRTMRIREGDPLEIYTDKDGEEIELKDDDDDDVVYTAGNRPNYNEDELELYEGREKDVAADEAADAGFEIQDEDDVFGDLLSGMDAENEEE